MKDFRKNLEQIYNLFLFLYFSYQSLTITLITRFYKLIILSFITRFSFLSIFYKLALNFF